LTLGACGLALWVVWHMCAHLQSFWFPTLGPLYVIFPDISKDTLVVHIEPSILLCLSVWFCRCNGLLFGTCLKHLEVVPLFGTSFLGLVYQHRAQSYHATFCGGHICLGIPGVGSGCILHIIRSVVVDYRGHVCEAFVIVRGGHLCFCHGHQVDQIVFCPHPH